MKTRKEYAKIRRKKRLAVRREKVIKLFRLAQETDEQERQEEYERTVAEIQSEYKKMPDYNEKDGTFLIDRNVTYPNGMPFRIKVVEHEGRFYMSDCGKTIDYLSRLSNKKALIRYFKNTLKSENICVIKNTICTAIDDIYDLTQEGALLFNVVSDLITKGNPDRYCFNEEHIKLANTILGNADAATIVKILAALDNEPMCFIALRKALHIGHARATRIIDTLTELKIIESSETLSLRLGKISNSFVAYLRWMLYNRKQV